MEPAHRFMRDPPLTAHSEEAQGVERSLDQMIAQFIAGMRSLALSQKDRTAVLRVLEPCYEASLEEVCDQRCYLPLWGRLAVGLGLCSAGIGGGPCSAWIVGLLAPLPLFL